MQSGMQSEVFESGLLNEENYTCQRTYVCARTHNMISHCVCACDCGGGPVSTNFASSEG